METAVLTLTDFLLARIAEDAAVALEAGMYLRSLHAHDATPGLAVAGTRVWSVDRVLAECEAKRRIVGALGQYAGKAIAECDTLIEHAQSDGARFSLVQMAAVYSDHPDYRSDWRPSA